MLFIYLLLFSCPAWAEKVLEQSPCDSYQSGTDALDRVLVELALNATGVDRDLLLESGEHCIWNFSLVRHVEQLSIVGNGSVTIKCFPGVGLAFYNATQLRLANLVIDGCGLELDYFNDFLKPVRSDLDFFFNGNYSNNSTYIAVALGNCIDFEITDSRVMNSSGLGLLGINLMGQSRFTNVSFEQNIPQGCFQYKGAAQLSFERIGGGALLAYLDYNEETYPTPDVNVDVRNCSFIENSYCGVSSIYNINSDYTDDLGRYLGGGGGMTISFSQLQYEVSLAITDSIFQNNTGFYGGGIYIVYYTGVFNSSVVIEGCTFEANGVDASLAANFSFPVIGSAIGIYTDFVQPNFSVRELRESYPSTVSIRDCDFVNNTAFTGVVAIFSLYNLVLPEEDRSELQLQLERCSFKNNKAVNGPVFYAMEFKASPTQRGIAVTFKDIEAVHNEVLPPSNVLRSPMLSGVIHLNQINFTITGNTSLQHNIGSAIRAMSSVLYLQGNILIHNNTAAYGGGMNLDGTLAVILLRNANVTFSNNSGGVAGGAVFVQFTTSATNFAYNDCFMYFIEGFVCSILGDDACDDFTKSEVQINFKGNKAQLGGMIYGSTLETCPWATKFRLMYAPGTQFSEKRFFEILYDSDGNNFTSPFQFDRRPDDTTAVTTPVLNLKVKHPDQNSIISNLTLAPGIRRKVVLSATDAFGQLVPAVVTSLSSAVGTVSIVGSNYSFINYNSSLNTSLSVTPAADNPTNSSTEVTLYTLTSLSHTVLNISFVPCPDGYYFNSTSNNCTCLNGLGNYRITCTPEGGLIVPLNTWLGVEKNRAQVVTSCSFDYCSRQIIDISITPAYNQCREGYNRSGPGCGGCVANYSVVFGSNSCRPCSNVYLLLLLPFAALGVLLMAVLLLLRISIAGGLLNGVLYFSNIVSLYGPLLAPNYSFILFSWLSLKFGIESCFFDGMKPIHAATLSFVFPLYLYLLVFVIVMMARQSSKFSDFLFRTKSSPAKLFATILVMTYSSLLESCLQVLSFTNLHQITVETNETFSQTINQTFNRWRFDPSQRYFHGGHGALGTLAVFLLVFFLIPAPILWMFPARIFSIQVLRRYKPIYDAVWAPLKPRYLFWVSLRLLYRIPPLIFVSFFPVPTNLVLLTMFLIVTLFVQGTIQPFERPLQNTVDRFLQLLLLIVTVLTLYFALLLPNGEADLADLSALNARVRFVERVQLPTIAFIITIIYVTCGLVFFLHLLTVFPGIKRLVAITWNKVTCKKFKVKIDNEKSTRPRESTVIVQSDMSINYDEVNEKIPETPVRSTFSELREPLLDAGGTESLRLYTVDS